MDKQFSNWHRTVLRNWISVSHTRPWRRFLFPVRIICWTSRAAHLELVKVCGDFFVDVRTPISEIYGTNKMEHNISKIGVLRDATRFLAANWIVSGFPDAIQKKPRFFPPKKH